jgi:hypothetical protein
MTTYTIHAPYGASGESFTAPSHRAAHTELCRRLGVGYPRALRATTQDGAEVVASLYDGEDYIRTRDGRVIRTW